MTEWEVIGVIIVLVTFALAVGAPVLKLTRSINVLTVTVQHLKDLLDEMKKDNKAAHDEIWMQIDEHSERLSKHSKQIAVLEERTHEAGK